MSDAHQRGEARYLGIIGLLCERLLVRLARALRPGVGAVRAGGGIEGQLRPQEPAGEGGGDDATKIKPAVVPSTEGHARTHQVNTMDVEPCRVSFSFFFFLPASFRYVQWSERKTPRKGKKESESEGDEKGPVARVDFFALRQLIRKLSLLISVQLIPAGHLSTQKEGNKILRAMASGLVRVQFGGGPGFRNMRRGETTGDRDYGNRCLRGLVGTHAIYMIYRGHEKKKKK